MQKNKLNTNRGFILGLALIILSAVLTISISISTILLRDLKLSIASVDTQTAYSLSDSILSCAAYLDRNFATTTASGTKKFFSDSNNLKDNYLELDSIYDLSTVKCFGTAIFNPTPSYTNLTTPWKVIVSGSGTTTISTTTISQISPTDTLPYRGGVLTKFELQGANLPDKSCLILEVYATSTGERMYVARGRLPCTGTKIIERVIVKTLN